MFMSAAYHQLVATRTWIANNAGLEQLKVV